MSTACSSGDRRPLSVAPKRTRCEALECKYARLVPTEAPRWPTTPSPLPSFSAPAAHRLLLEWLFLRGALDGSGKASLTADRYAAGRSNRRAALDHPRPPRAEIARLGAGPSGAWIDRRRPC